MMPTLRECTSHARFTAKDISRLDDVVAALQKDNEFDNINDAYIEAAHQIAAEATAHRASIMSVLDKEDAAVKQARARPAPPPVQKFNNVTALAEAIAKENKFPAPVLHAYTESKVLGRSLADIGKDIGVPKSTVGEWVQKMHPLVEAAKRDRLETNPRDVTAQVAAPVAAPVAAETKVEEAAPDQVNSEENGDAIDTGDATELANTGDLLDEDNVAQGQGEDGHSDSHINIADDMNGEGKTSANNNIDKDRSKALSKAWGKLNAKLPESERVAWDDLGSAQQDTFDGVYSDKFSSARIAEVHAGITTSANEGVRFAKGNLRLKLSSGTVAGLNVSELVAPAQVDAATLSAWPALTDDPSVSHTAAGITWRSLDESARKLLGATLATLEKSSLSAFIKLAYENVSHVGTFGPNRVLGPRVAAAWWGPSRTTLFSEARLQPNPDDPHGFGMVNVVAHESVHALDTAAAEHMGIGWTGVVATLTEQSPTNVAVKLVGNRFELKYGAVLKEVLKAYGNDRDLVVRTYLDFDQALSRLYEMLDVLADNDFAPIDGFDEVDLHNAAEIAATELTPKLMEMLATAPKLLAGLPKALAHITALSRATTIEQAAHILGGTNATNANTQISGADTSAQAVRGQVQGATAPVARADSGRVFRPVEEVAGAGQDRGRSNSRAGGVDAGLIPPPVLDRGKGVVQWVKNLTSDKLWRTAPGTLGFLSTEQLAERFKEIPMVKAFSDTMRAMSGLAQKIMVASDRAAGSWGALARKHGSEIDTRFSKLLLDATTINAWPNEELGVGRNRHVKTDDDAVNAAHQRNQQVWRGLPEAYRTLFDEVVADKAAHRDLKIDLLRKSLIDSYYPDVGDTAALQADVIDAAANLKKGDRAAFKSANAKSMNNAKTLDQLWDHIDTHDVAFRTAPGPYFPKMRFGDHIVSYKSPGFQQAEVQLKHATESLQTLLRADTYAPIAQAEQDIESITRRQRRATVAETKAALKQELKDAVAERDLLMQPIELARELVRTRQDALMELKKQGAHYGVAFYEARSQAQVYEERLKAHFADKGDGTVVRRDLKNTFLRSMDGVTPEFMRRLEDKMASALPGADQQKVKDSMRELYLRLQPDNSAMKSQLKRFNVEGVRPEEAQRAYSTSSMRDAHSISRLKYGHKLSEHVNALRFTREDEDSKLIGNELAKRVVQNTATNDNAFFDAITNVSYLSYLGLSPSFMVTQLTQPWIISAPVLAARHGIRDTAKHLSAASLDAAALMKSSFDKDRRMKFLLEPASGNLAADEVKLLTDMLDSGRIDITVTRDLGVSAQGNTGVMATAAQIASYPAQQLEVVNRVATALAAYRMEKAKMGNILTATNYADSVVSDTHLNYATENRARHMHPSSYGGYGRVMFQFRNYQQGMLYLIYKNMIDGFGAKKDPEARRAVAYLAGMQLATAGLAGMPIPGVLAVAVGMLYKSMTPDDDEQDLKEMLFQGIKSVLGETGAIAATRGIPAALGVDIANSVGMGSIASVAPFVDDRLDGRKQVGAYFNAMVGGASLGMIANWGEAVKAAGEGDWMKATALAAPKVLSSPTKAIGYQTHGMLDSRGNTILAAEEISAVDSLIKGLGFQPTSMNRVGNQRQAFLEAKYNRNDARNKLLADFAHARMNGGDTQSVREDVQDFNSRHPDNRITPVALEQAVMKRRQNEKNLRHGVPVSKRDRALAQDLGID